MASKNQVVLIESNSAHRKLLSFNLDVYLGVEIVYKYNAEDVIDFLKYDADRVRLIISEELVGKEQTVLKVYYHVVSKNLGIPIILSGYCSKLVGKIEMFPREQWRNILRKCGEVVGITSKEMARTEVDKYYPVPIDIFLVMKIAPVQIFVHKVTDKFEVLFKKGGIISQKDIRYRLFKGVNCLFILSQERLKFADDFSQQVFDLLEKEEMSVKERVVATGMAFEKVRTLVKTVGMSDEVVKRANAVVESVVKIASSSHGLSDLMEILHESEESYLYLHGLLISVASYQIIGAMDWGNEEQKIKIAFAAFFHDITIPHENLCKIHSQQELEGGEISEEDKDSVMRHAFNASELVKSVSNTPFGVDTIIIQHHGSLNGVGFQGGEQDNRLSKLAMLFLVVEDYCDTLLDEGREFFHHQRTIKKLEATYTQKDFRKIVDALGFFGEE